MHSPASTCRQPRYPCSTPRVQSAPCPLSPPPYLYTFENYRAFSLSTSPPLRGKGMFSTFRLRGGGTKADTSLFPVIADHIGGSNILNMSSVKAHGHTGSPPPARASVAEAAHGSAYSYKQARGHPPSRRGTNGILIGRHMNGLRKHFVVKPDYRKKAFLVCIPKMGRSSAVPPSGHTGSHALFIHPHTNKQKQGRPPRQPRGNGGRGGDTARARAH
jgi:hypothetical protein